VVDTGHLQIVIDRSTGKPIAPCRFGPWLAAASAVRTASCRSSVYGFPPAANTTCSAVSRRRWRAGRCAWRRLAPVRSACLGRRGRGGGVVGWLGVGSCSFETWSSRTSGTGRPC